MSNDRPKWIAWIIVPALVLAASVFLLAKPPAPPSAPGTAPSAATSNTASATTSTSTQPKITWSQPSVTIILLPGDIKQRNVMFRSSAVLQNASLEAVPEIARFLKVTPSVIPALQSNHEQSVQIQATIPVGTPSSNYDGTIQVREQSAT